MRKTNAPHFQKGRCAEKTTGIRNSCLPCKNSVSSPRKLNEPQRQKTYLRTYACSEDSDQPAHSRSLIRIFIARILIATNAKFLHADNEHSDQPVDILPYLDTSIRYMWTPRNSSHRRIFRHFVVWDCCTRGLFFWSLRHTSGYIHSMVPRNSISRPLK